MVRRGRTWFWREQAAQVTVCHGSFRIDSGKAWLIRRTWQDVDGTSSRGASGPG